MGADGLWRPDRRAGMDANPGRSARDRARVENEATPLGASRSDERVADALRRVLGRRRALLGSPRGNRPQPPASARATGSRPDRSQALGLARGVDPPFHANVSLL